jgi:hypothetical protein
MENIQTEIKPKRGRPKKYNTPEEAHQANLDNMKKKYAEKTAGAIPKPLGRKPTKTIEEIREGFRLRQRKYLQNKKEKET